MVKLHTRPTHDAGVTLLEVLATLVILALILPAIYTTYITIIRSSETALTRLRCVNMARQEVEARKAEGFEAIWDQIDAIESTSLTPLVSVPDIQIATTAQRTTLLAPDNVKTIPALRLSVTAVKDRVSTTLDFMMVQEGY